MNFLLDLNFLSSTYIEWLKNLSFYLIVSGALCIAFLLLKYLFWKKWEKEEHNFTTYRIFCDMGMVITFIIGILIMIALAVLLVIYPACYLAALIKDILVARYLYEPELLTFSRELFINIISSALAVIPYIYIIVKSLKNFVEDE